MTEPTASNSPGSPVSPELPRDKSTAVLERLVTETVREQRLRRRWGIFFKLLFVAYAIGVLFVIQADGVSVTTGPHTALVDIEGVIGADADIDADAVAGALKAAFESADAVGVIVRINSPGGSPVQSSYLNAEIRRLRGQHPDRPLHAVITDIGASGGYYIAVAAERIWADPASLVGSIGVLMDGFGFVDAMRKMGVERRLITAGEHKGLFDPFSPMSDDDRGRAQNLLNRVHRQFIAAVRAGRGDRLTGGDEVFSGMVWTGEQARELGLIDDFGSAAQVARNVIGAERIVDYTPRVSLLERVSREIGMAAVNAVLRAAGPLGGVLR